MAGVASSNIANLVINITVNEQQFGQNLNRMGNKMKSFGKSMTNAGKTMTKAFTVPIVAGLGYAVKSAADFEEAMSAVKANSGAVGKEFSNLSDLALKAGAETKYSALEAARGMDELVRAGLSTQQIMEGGLMGALNLAAAGELKLADAAEIAATVLNSFKKDGLNMAQAADILAGAANKSATSVGELKFSLSMVSAVASGVGMSFKDTSTALAVFAQNGLKGSDAGTSLKTMLMNLTPNTDKAAKQFKKLGLLTEQGTSAFYDAQGNIKGMADIAGLLKGALKDLNAEQRLSALRTMFGADAIRAANILYKEGAEGVKAMSDEIAKVKATDVAATKMDNFKGSIEELSGSVETFAIKIGLMLTPYIRKLTDNITKLTNKFIDLPDSVKMTVVVVAALIAGIGPLLMLLGACASGLGVLAGFFSFLISPIGLVIAGLVALGLNTGIIQKAFAWMGKAVKTFATELTTTKDIGTAFKNTIAKMVPKEVQQNIQNIIDKLIQLKNEAIAIGAKIQAVSKVIQSFFSGTTSQKRDILTGLVGEENANKIINLILMIQQKFQGFMGVMQSVGDRFKLAFASLVEQLPSIQAAWERLKTSFAGFIEACKPIHEILGVTLVTAIGVVIGAIQGLIQAFSPLVAAVMDAVSIIMDLFSLLVGFITGDTKMMEDAISRLCTNVISLFKNLWDTVVGFVKGLVEGCLGWFTDLYYQVVGGSIIPDLVNGVIRCFANLLSNVVGKVKDLASSVVNNFLRIKDSIMGVVSQAGQWGKNLMSNLISGISSKASALANKASEIASSIADFLGWHSPTRKGEGRDSDKWAPNLMSMMNKGLMDDQVKIQRTLTAVVNPTFTPPEIPTSWGRTGAPTATTINNVTNNGANGAGQNVSLNLSGSVKMIGVNDNGQMVAAVNYTAEELARNMDRMALNPSPRRIFQA